jgi:hypothetical protein
MIAYNFDGWLKYVHLRVERTWSEIFDALECALLTVPSVLEIEVALTLANYVA